MGMNLCRRRIELCSDPTALNRRDLALTCAHHWFTAEWPRRAAALSSHPRGRRFGHANVPGYNTGGRQGRRCSCGTEVHTPHPNILTRSQVAGRRAADARRRGAQVTDRTRLLCKLQRTIPYKIELGVVR
jgi:hypothetical protein